MGFRTRWIWLLLAAFAMILALAAAPSPSSAASTPDKDVPQPIAAAASDAVAPGDATDRTLVALQLGCDDHDRWDGWWVVGPIIMVLFWGTVIGVVVWAIRQFTRGRGETSWSPLDIAKERYARGEINAEEFEKLRRDLS